MFFTPVMRHAAHHAHHNNLRSLDRSLERFLSDAVASPARQTGVTAHAFEQDDTSFTLRLDVPGVAKEHLSIGIEGAVVRVESLADAPRPVKAAYELPQEIDAAASEAKLEHCLLTIKLSKKVPVSNVASLAVH
jgi:HSP20 family protein